jgi:hypothetical protein
MNPIETAVLPLKAAAIERARNRAVELIENMREQLAAVDFDLDRAAPYPKTNIGRPAYMVAMSRRQMFQRVFRPTKCSRKMTDPDTVYLNEECRDLFIQHAGENAAFEYDAFVAKLNAKIGEVVSAELEGNHVWGHSILRVVKADGTKENWKTQMIINVSKLGKLFNQFPTRKVK